MPPKSRGSQYSLGSWGAGGCHWGYVLPQPWGGYWWGGGPPGLRKTGVRAVGFGGEPENPPKKGRYLLRGRSGGTLVEGSGVEGAHGAGRAGGTPWAGTGADGAQWALGEENRGQERFGGPQEGSGVPQRDSGLWCEARAACSTARPPPEGDTETPKSCAGSGALGLFWGFGGVLGSPGNVF